MITDHENISNTIEIIHTYQCFVIISYYGEHLKIYDIFLKTDIKIILKNIISGIRYLDKHGLIPKLITPDNIIKVKINSHEIYKIKRFTKVGYLNLSSQDDSHDIVYRAPSISQELSHSDHISNSIWSVGIVGLQLCGGEVYTLKKNDYFIRGLIMNISNISEDFKDVLQKILKVNQNERLTLNQIEKHPFFRGFRLLDINDILRSKNLF